MSDPVNIPLTADEREGLAHLFDPAAFEASWLNERRQAEHQRVAYHQADHLLASEWLAARDARVRADALAPISALTADLRKRAGGLAILRSMTATAKSEALSSAADQLDAALAAGVDTTHTETSNGEQAAPVRIFYSAGEVEDELLAMSYERGLLPRLAGIDARGVPFFATLAEEGGDSVYPLVLTDHQHETSYDLAGETPCETCGCPHREWSLDTLTYPVQVLHAGTGTHEHTGDHDG